MKEKNLNYNRNADVIKALLIIAVITLHFPFKDITDTAPLFPYFLDFAVPGFMFISGYLRTLSVENKGVSSLEGAYTIKSILKSILRIVIPFTLFFIFAQIFLRIIGFYTVGITEYGLLALFFDYLRGFTGQGSYYFPVMIQFIFVFPIIWRIIKKNGFKGVWIVFFMNLLFEVLKQAFGMSDFEYRYLVFRYLFIIACGSYAAVYKPGKSGLNIALMIASVAAGAAFIYLFVYSGYGQSAKIITYWQRTSLLTCLYAAPILFFVIAKGNLKFKPLEIIGKASFNIFLVQMLYYLYYHFTASRRTGSVTEYLVTVLICVVIGVAFYYPEQLLTKFLIKKFSRT